MANDTALEPLRPVQMPGQGYEPETEYKSEDYRNEYYAGQQYDAGPDHTRSGVYDTRSISKQSLLNSRGADGKSGKAKAKSPAKGVPHWVRIVLRILSLLLSATIIGIIANLLVIYSKNWKANWKYDHGHRLNSWPSPMNWTPTNLMLGAASLVILFNLIALASLFGCFKQFKLSSFGRLTTLLSSVIALVAWTAAVALYKAYDKPDKNKYDLWSWTCSHKYIKLRAGGKVVGLDFICGQMSYVFYAGIAIAVLELLGLLAIGYNLRANKRIDKSRAQGDYKQLGS